MNDLLQNKWVVASLAVVAALIVAIRFWPQSRPRSRAKAPAASSTKKTETAAATSAKVASSTPSAGALGAGGPPAGADATPTVDGAVAEPADRVYLAEHFREWRESPVRDPFDSGIREKEPEVRIPPAKEVLSLTAIWRQTGDSLAVVNSQLVGIADRVDGYEVLGIAMDSIWVDGHKGVGREEVPFGVRKVPATSRKGTAKSSSRSRTTSGGR